jgi:rhodanese-related sulfurtransferase
VTSNKGTVQFTSRYYTFHPDIEPNTPVVPYDLRELIEQLSKIHGDQPETMVTIFLLTCVGRDDKKFTKLCQLPIDQYNTQTFTLSGQVFTLAQFDINTMNNTMWVDEVLPPKSIFGSQPKSLPQSKSIFGPQPRSRRDVQMPDPRSRQDVQMRDIQQQQRGGRRRVQDLRMNMNNQPICCNYPYLYVNLLQRIQQFIGETDKSWNYITPTQLYQELYPKRNPKLFLLDIRKREDYLKTGHIKGSVNIFWQDIYNPNNLKKLPCPLHNPDQTIVLICYVGHTSSQILVLLKLLGFNVVALKFGMGISPVKEVPIRGWLDYKYPITHTPTTSPFSHQGECRPKRS